MVGAGRLDDAAALGCATGLVGSTNFVTWQHYKTFRQTAENEAKAKEQFPNSVMLRTSYYTDELEVDEVSAWRVGWNQRPKSWYQGFEPPQ